MNKRWKIALAAAALGVAGLSAHEARAGNFTTTLTNDTVGIWSLELALGQYADFTNAGGFVLLDDITYTVKAWPCDYSSEATCVFIEETAIPIQETGPMGIGSRTPTWGGGGFGSWTYVQKYTHARAEHDHVYLTDWDGTSSSPPPPSEFVDHFAITWYGELIGMTSEFFQWGNLGEGPLEMYPYFGMTGDHPLSLSIAAVPASQSRHYQTPYIVKYGKLHYRQALLGNIVFAWANLKGRFVLPGNPPQFGISTYPIGQT